MKQTAKQQEAARRIVAECWTCAEYLDRRGIGRRAPQHTRESVYCAPCDLAHRRMLTAAQAEQHRSAGHDVREVTREEPDHSIPYDGCTCGDALCGGCDSEDAR